MMTRDRQKTDYMFSLIFFPEILLTLVSGETSLLEEEAGNETALDNSCCTKHCFYLLRYLSYILYARKH